MYYNKLSVCAPEWGIINREPNNIMSLVTHPLMKENRTPVFPVVKQRHYKRILEAQKTKYPTHIKEKTVQIESTDRSKSLLCFSMVA